MGCDGGCDFTEKDWKKIHVMLEIQLATIFHISWFMSFTIVLVRVYHHPKGNPVVLGGGSLPRIFIHA